MNNITIINDIIIFSGNGGYSPFMRQAIRDYFSPFLKEGKIWTPENGPVVTGKDGKEDVIVEVVPKSKYPLVGCSSFTYTITGICEGRYNDANIVSFEPAKI
jgi:hypothetical protein